MVRFCGVLKVFIGLLNGGSFVLCYVVLFAIVNCLLAMCFCAFGFIRMYIVTLVFFFCWYNYFCFLFAIFIWCGLFYFCLLCSQCAKRQCVCNFRCAFFYVFGIAKTKCCLVEYSSFGYGKFACACET